MSGWHVRSVRCRAVALATQDVPDLPSVQTGAFVDVIHNGRVRELGKDVDVQCDEFSPNWASKKNLMPNFEFINHIV